MGGKNRKKRKNSSQGESAHTSKSNKEAKSGSPGVVSDNSFNNSQLSSSQYLYSSPCVTTSNPLPMNMNMNNSPGGSVFGSPAGVNMQYGMGAVGPMGPMGTMGPMSSPAMGSSGQCIGMPPNPSFNMANLITSTQPAQNMSSQSAMPMQQQSSNSELMKFLTVKFDEVNKR